MAQGKKSRRRRSRASRIPWLPLAVAGVIVVIGAVALVLARDDQDTNSTSSSPIDPNFTPAVSGGPSVEVAQEYFDYGDVKLGEVVKTVFDVRNVGDQALTILGEPRVELIEGCWPPRAVVSSTTIDPGYKATVSVEFMMHGDMGGQHEFRVHLLTNDPVEPEKLLTIRSNWVP